MSFAYPYILLAGLLIPLIYYLSRRTRPSAIRFPIIDQDTSYTSWRIRWRWLIDALQILGWAIIIFCLARPQLERVDRDIKGEGIDIYLVLDLSSSMLARDFKPDRITASKRVAADFISKRNFDRIGLSVFAGESYTRCPATTDYDLLTELLEGIQVGDNLRDGTAIGMGLGNAIHRLDSSQASSKIIILLTDGVNTTGYIEPETASQLAKQAGIKVYTIGIGSEGQALSPVGKRADGQYVFDMARVEIDEALLKEIAHETGGEYYRAHNALELESIYTAIDKLERSEIEVSVIRETEDIYRRYLPYGLLFLLASWIARRWIFRIVP